MIYGIIAMITMPLLFGYIVGRNHVDPEADPGYYRDPE